MGKGGGRQNQLGVYCHAQGDSSEDAKGQILEAKLLLDGLLSEPKRRRRGFEGFLDLPLAGMGKTAGEGGSCGGGWG